MGPDRRRQVQQVQRALRPALVLHQAPGSSRGIAGVDAFGRRRAPDDVPSMPGAKRPKPERTECSGLNLNGEDRQVPHPYLVPSEPKIVAERPKQRHLRGSAHPGVCGICTVHANGEPVRACVTTLAEVTGKRIVTIEGLAVEPRNRMIEVWIAEQASQCGYCQPGQIMAAATLLARRPSPRHRAVLDLAVERARWGTPPPKGRHRGLAVYPHSAATSLKSRRYS